MMRMLKKWSFAISMMPEMDNSMKSMRRFLDFIDSGMRRVDFRDPIGITGELYGSNFICDGTIVHPMRIRRIERTKRFRGLITSFRVMVWQFERIEETYRVYTEKGVFYIRLCDFSDDTKVIFDDLLEGAKRLEELRSEPFRVATI